LLLVACGPEPEENPPPGSTPSDPTDPTPPEPTVGLDLDVVVPAAFDPLHGPVELALITAEGADVTLWVEQDETEVATWSGTADGGTFAVTWDGKDGSGAWAHAGQLLVKATASDGTDTTEAMAAAYVVRAAFQEARLVDDDGVTSLRVPLYWPADQALRGEAEPVSMLAAVDDGTVPLDFAPIDLTSLVQLPESAEPAAYRAGDVPILELLPATESTAIGPTGIDIVDVTVTADGWTAASTDPLTADQPIVLVRDTALDSTLGITEEEVVFTFSFEDIVLGVQRLPLRMYRVLDESQFDAPAERYEPWVAIVDPALTAIEGTPAETDVVLDALVDFVYFDLGLEYDTVAGASFYSTYQAGFFDGPHFYLSDFLARKDGNVVNCSDSANILGAYANMVGVRLDHLIIEPGFDLNYIQAIGYTTFTSCPFGPGGCGFSYHAVTTYPAAYQIWDATLALDGDDDSGSPPHVELLVQSIDGAEYLERLVRSGNTEYGHQAQETLE
jgi:hypothetical protein